VHQAGFHYVDINNHFSQPFVQYSLWCIRLTFHSLILNSCLNYMVSPAAVTLLSGIHHFHLVYFIFHSCISLPSPFILLPFIYIYSQPYTFCQYPLFWHNNIRLLPTSVSIFSKFYGNIFDSKYFCPYHLIIRPHPLFTTCLFVFNVSPSPIYLKISILLYFISRICSMLLKSLRVSSCYLSSKLWQA